MNLKSNSFHNNNGKKLLIPVSAAAATSKKTNQQILVVPTPGGGARLATTTTSASRSTRLPNFKSSLDNRFNAVSSSLGNSLLHSSTINKTTQFNNFTITNTTKPITTSLTNNLSLKNSRIINNGEKSIANSLLPAELTSTSIKRKLQSIEKLPQLVNNKQQHQEPKIDETKVKEEFLYKLGLVTKQALSEIQNKKSERKRRTTANPQFSTAAITAKRIEAQENAAKRAIKRREREDNLLNSSSNKRTFLNSNRGKAVNNNGKQQQQQQLQDRKAATAAAVPKLSSNHKQQQLSQSNSNSNEIKISRNCFVCDEVCDSDLDEIMFCEDCHCLFHVTCSSTIDRIKKTMGVPCPKCERKRSLAEESLPFNENSNGSEVLKQKALDSSNSNSSSIVSNKAICRRKIDRSKNVKFAKANKYANQNKNDQSKQNNKILTENSKPESDEEKYRCLVRYELLDRQVRDFKVKLALLKDKVYISKENRREMLIKKENSKRSIDSIINLVKKIQEQESAALKENQENETKLVNVPNVPNSTAKEAISNNESLNEQVVVLNEIDLTEKESENTIRLDKEKVMINDCNENKNEVNNDGDDKNNDVKNDDQISSNDQIMEEETNEAISNLNALNEISNSNDAQQQISVEEELKSAAEKDKDQQSKDKLKEKRLNKLDNRTMNKSEISINNERDESNEPPIKKICLSPTQELKIYSISQDDEVSAAIASIQD